MNDHWNGSYYKKHAISQKANALRAIQYLSLSGKECILDIGCGTGSVTKDLALAVPKGKVMGIDPSMQMLNQAIKDYASIPNLTFSNQSTENLSFSIKFDLVTSFTALHFVSNHATLLQQLRSILEPQGRLFFLMGSKCNQAILDVLDRPSWKSETKITLFFHGVEEYRELLHRCGWIINRLEIFPSCHHFPTKEKAIQFLMTWLPYATSLTEDRSLVLAEEITEELYRKQSHPDIKFLSSMLIVEAQLP